jgi:hypothetical protein
MSRDKKLLQYALKSNLMNVNISYGDEDFNFNLNSELVIDENKIDNEIKVQPSAYAFLGMLHKKLIRRSKEAEKIMERKYHELFIKFKSEKDEETHKSLNNDMVKAKIIKNVTYDTLWDEFIEAEHQAMIIEVCVKSFEQRSNLLQTLSANIRKEK